MTLIADIFLTAGCIGAALYCYILGRRLRAFNDLERGMGGAVAVLSAQVDDLEKSVTAAKTSAANSQQELEAVTLRAEDVRRQLEIQIAALHDVSSSAVSQDRLTPDQDDLRPLEAAKPHNEPMFTRHRASGRPQ